MAWSGVAGVGEAALPPTPVPIATHGTSTVASVGIDLEGTATAAGELRLVFTPQGGETVEIRTPIPASARAGTAARDLAAALTHAIGPDYAVTVSDAGRISIAYGKKERPFRVKLAAEPPPGLSVRFD